MDVWDWALLAFAGYVATMALVRLMARQRELLSAELRRKAEQERAQEPPQQPAKNKPRKSA